MSDDVLFCTDTFHEAHSQELAHVAPDLDFVLLAGDEPIVGDDLDRITIAHFSHDAWPQRARAFLRTTKAAPDLRWFHTMSAGVDSPVFGALLDRGVRLTTSSGSSAPPIARTVMMYLLALSRGLPAMIRAQDRAEWSWSSWQELEGRTIAIVGWGPIGREVARLAVAFGLRPTIVRRAARGGEPHPVRALDDLAAVARDHDVLVLALPLTDDTDGIVDEAVLDALGPTGLLVNVGRGELVDQPALVRALVESRIAGAGVDVTSPEPLPADDPLWRAPNLILTPHNSGSTDGTARRADRAFLDNLKRWIAGDPFLNEVASAR